MGYGQEYAALLEAIAEEADRIAMQYFRAEKLRVDRKGDGSAVTQADRAVEEMARAKVTASGLALDVLGEEMGGANSSAPNKSGRCVKAAPTRRPEFEPPNMASFPGVVLPVLTSHSAAHRKSS